MTSVRYEPELSIVGFRARTTSTAQPPRPAGSLVHPRTPPPFGTRRGNRVAYSINLTRSLADAVAAHVADLGVRTSLGSVAVTAIRTQWPALSKELEPNEDDLRFLRQRPEVGRLPLGEPVVRRILYVTDDEAEGIEGVRRSLFGVELGQLHRACLERYLSKR